jgi:hypothetical protein
MTVGVAVKVFDGIVLATDSATTIDLGPAGHQVYNSANKIFHLDRRYAVGAMTWGLGNIGAASIATVAKDLRRRFMGQDDSFRDWSLDDGFSVQSVGERLIDMVWGELYSNAFAGQSPAPLLGFMVAGYSSGSLQSEAWVVQMDDPSVRPMLERAAGPDESGWMVYAQPEAAVRLLKGVDPQILDVLQPHLTAAELAKVQAVLSSQVLDRQVVIPAMPLADALALAKFLTDTTVGYRRFVPGPDTVGGQVEIAVISRHEGFKWVSRKHYYSQDLNRRDLDHDC